MGKKKWIFILIFIFINTSFIGCNKKEVKEEKELHLYMDVKEEQSQEIIKFLVEEFKKENKDIKVYINNNFGGKNTIIEDIGKGNEADLIFTSRNTLIELVSKGVITNMASVIDKNKMGEKYYNIMKSYGRVGDQYYGVGVIPCSVEIYYNKDALNKLKLNYPTTMSDIQVIMKKMKKSGIRIPIVFGSDIDPYNGVASIIASNRIKVQKLENDFDSGNNAYKEIKDVQFIFDEINALVKNDIINENSFEVGNENTISKFSNSDIPILVTTSYYNNKLNSGNIGILDSYTGSSLGKNIVPIIVSAVVCMPTNSKNGEQALKFIKLAYSDKTQEKIANKGFVIGNKSSVNVKIIEKSIENHIAMATDNSIIFTYNLPAKMHKYFAKKIERVLSGKYNGEEWKEVVEETYKGSEQK